ncbi:hypothetical protein LguiA_008605 [Lonicera macranthoides]
MGRMGRMGNMVHGFKPTLIMVLVQTMFAGANVFFKLAANDGMNLRILVAYRFLFASAFMIPLALYVERKKRPKMTRIVLVQAFFCGLLGGVLAQNMYVMSLALTSASFASAMTNLIPAITFIMAIIFRLEKLGWRTAAGKAKVLGTLVGLGGAMILTFYKGPRINLSTNVDLLHKSQTPGHVAPTHKSGQMLLGSLLSLGSCICYALWLILQAKMAERYPCPYSTTALMVFFGSFQGVIFAICTQSNWSQWQLGWNIRLLTVAYTGIVASGLMFTLVAWCVHMRGPLFVSVFNPLMLVLVTIAGTLVLDEKLHLGSIIGAVLIVCGLYVVLWGKGKEMKRIARLMPERNSSGGPGGPGGDSKRIEVLITSTPQNNISNRVEVGVSSPNRPSTPENNQVERQQV